MRILTCLTASLLGAAMIVVTSARRVRRGRSELANLRQHEHRAE